MRRHSEDERIATGLSAGPIHATARPPHWGCLPFFNLASRSPARFVTFSALGALAASPRMAGITAVPSVAGRSPCLRFHDGRHRDLESLERKIGSGTDRCTCGERPSTRSRLPPDPSGSPMLWSPRSRGRQRGMGRVLCAATGRVRRHQRRHPASPLSHRRSGRTWCVLTSGSTKRSNR